MGVRLLLLLLTAGYVTQAQVTAFQYSSIKKAPANTEPWFLLTRWPARRAY